MKSESNDVWQRAGRLSLVIGLSSILATGCGGGGSSSDSDPDSFNPLVQGDEDGTPADAIETSILLRNAASESSSSLGKNVTSLQRLGGNSSSLDLLLAATPLDTLLTLTLDDPTAEPVNSDELLNAGFEDDISGLLESMLGTEGSTSQVTRTGNRITIDPDEAAFCDQELLDDTATATDRANCQELISQVLVEVDAVTEESGLITFTFAQADVLLIGYSPVTANYEVKLAGLQTLLSQAAQLQDDPTSVPSMQGAIRVSATVTNDTLNEEAGTFSISVTEALSIVDNTGTDISLQPSTLLSVTSDSAMGTGSIEIDIAAFNASVSSDDGTGGLSTSVLALAGLTARMDVFNDGNTLQVSNMGLGNGPLTLTVDSVELLSMMLSTFGFTINGDTGQITLNNDLDLAVSIAELTSLAVSAPSGTEFTNQADGSTLVSQGGPFTTSVVPAGGSGAESISIGSGECFMSNEVGDTDLPFVIVSCTL